MMSTLMRWSGWFIPSGKTGDGRDAVAPDPDQVRTIRL
jgi:hypothetical protein